MTWCHLPMTLSALPSVNDSGPITHCPIFTSPGQPRTNPTPQQSTTPPLSLAVGLLLSACSNASSSFHTARRRSTRIASSMAHMRSAGSSAKCQVTTTGPWQSRMNRPGLNAPTCWRTHFLTVKAASSPIACAVRDDGSLERELHAVTHTEPVLDITGDDGLQQTVWRINDVEAEHRIMDRLRGEPLFIIDGHHRSAANQRLDSQGVSLPVLTTVFPEQSLHLVGFHRLLTLDDDVDQADILLAIQRRFRVETVSDVATVAPGQVAIVLGGERHLVHFDERPVEGGASILLGSLDPVVLEREVLESIVGRFGSYQTAYTPDIEPFAIIEAEAIAHDQIPIFVPPVAIEDMMAVAEGDVIMPAKSTYFTPKVRSGVFLRMFDELDDAWSV